MTATATTPTPLPARMRVEMVVTVDRGMVDDFIDLIVMHSDGFMQSFSGYWARGEEHIDSGDPRTSGWIVHEFLNYDDHPVLSDEAMQTLKAQVVTLLGEAAIAEGLAEAMYDPQEQERGDSAIAALMPPGYHFLGWHAARRGIRYGVKEYGHPYFLDGGADYGDYDCAVQAGILGEVKYG